MNWEKYFIEREYQKSPTDVQKRALEGLSKLNLFHDLKEFKPVFAGTIPLDIDIQSSDINIICEVTEFIRYQTRLRECFERQKNFIITETYNAVARNSTCRFDAHTFRVEIHGEKKTIQKQNLFQYLIAEAKLLEIGGDAARAEIRRIKRNGHKTEPAFAEYFKIKGNAFDELVKLSTLSVEEIKTRLS